MKKKNVGIALAIFLAGGLGTAVGSAGAAEPTIKTVTVQGPERVVTKEVTKEVTPQGCLDALESAKTVFEAVAAEHTAFGAASTKASGDGDVPAFIASMTAAIKDMNTVVTAQTDPMATAASACRSAK